jgi:hypothetical protein
MPVLATLSLADEAASTPGAAMGAVISGVLTINANDCFEVGRYFLVTPYGSRVTKNPVGIHVPGVGDIPVGPLLNS